MSATPLVPSPIVLYARLIEASAALARQIRILDTHEPTLAQPLEAAWIVLDDLLEQFPASLAQEATPRKDTPMMPRDALQHLDRVLDTLERLLPGFHTADDHAALTEARLALADVAQRLADDLARDDARVKETP